MSERRESRPEVVRSRSRFWVIQQVPVAALVM